MPVVPGSAFANGGATCVNVFVADDAAVIRKAIRSLLSNREDISVVGEASDFRETIQKTSQLHPDLIILDLSMPDRGHVPTANRSKKFVERRESFSNDVRHRRAHRRTANQPDPTGNALLAVSS